MKVLPGDLVMLIRKNDTPWTMRTAPLWNTWDPEKGLSRHQMTYDDVAVVLAVKPYVSERAALVLISGGGFGWIRANWLMMAK